MRHASCKIFLLMLWAIGSCHSQKGHDERLLETLMEKEPSKFRYILDQRDSLEVQILYTQINRDSANNPIFKSYFFNLDSTRYFYPASTIKLPLVVLSLEKLNQLHIKGLDKFTPVFHDSVYSGQRSIREDLTSENHLPSIAHYIRKVLMVSDNDASNALYEFMGQQAANDQLRKHGYNIRILHRLSRSLTAEQNRHTEVLRFVRNDTLIYKQESLVNPDSIRPNRVVLKGTGYMDHDSLVRKPFDFSYKNSFPLQEQQEILKAILFPETVNPKKRFDLTAGDRRFLLQYMSQLPRETSYPPYRQDTALYDASVKFFMFAEDRRPIPSSIRIFNKIGGAYGYVIDNAYIVDFDKGVEFMLSAVISTNRDGIFNDDKYDYKTIGYPFMRDLGQLIYQYEVNRVRERKPDLSEFKLTYNH